MCSFIDLQKRILELPNSFDLSDSLKSSKLHSYNSRIPSRVERLVLHHSAHPTWSVYDIAEYHVSTNKWPGIGYHIGISQKGDVFICNKLSNQSYHVAGKNFNSIGICCFGNFEIDSMPEIQERALMMVLWQFGVFFKELKLFRHSDLAQTLCPGLHFPFDACKSHYLEAIKYRSIEM